MYTSVLKICTLYPKGTLTIEKYKDNMSIRLKEVLYSNNHVYDNVDGHYEDGKSSTVFSSSSPGHKDMGYSPTHCCAYLPAVG